MKKYFAYTRVSTVKQGTKGVSLQEQKSAIEAYALRNGLEITEWFEETITAAKTGRVLFTQIIKRLRKNEAQGLIIHKIDRSARNLKDWAALGELIDTGVDVRVTAESYDLNSRGGRLSADIQAVIAADYIRNLREETIKGMRGRLKQGIYPLKAPIGYVDNGGGQLKTHDPIKAPLVRTAFELYASGRFSVISISKEIYKRGLRSHTGGRLCKNGLHRILKNPFYYGTIYVKTTGETFSGKHKPLISKQLFDQVQKVMAGKYHKQIRGYDFTYRRVFKCGLCDYSVIGEIQKGHTYYRCHTKSCPMKTVREEALVAMIDEELQFITKCEKMVELLAVALETKKHHTYQFLADNHQALNLQLTKLELRVEKLMDMYLDGNIQDKLFETKNRTLISEIDRIKNLMQITDEDIRQILNSISEFLELAKTLISSYKTTPNEFRGELLKTLTSNPTVSPTFVDIPIETPWSLFVNAGCIPLSGLYRDTPRTKKLQSDPLAESVNDVLNQLIEFFSDNENPLLLSSDGNNI